MRITLTDVILVLAGQTISSIGVLLPSSSMSRIVPQTKGVAFFYLYLLF